MDPASTASPPPPAATAAYRVLARTYRPARLSELIGQEALVRTLRNAFASGRIAHAFLLTGIRGTGKTTTARIIAMGLNCTGPDDLGGPTPEPCGVCSSCRAIASGRSLDVIELDAASNTGINDMRELQEGIMFGPSASRSKVYVLDEAHMLSPQAWNSMLKTVEEPPPHAKFIFATTEARKVPVTVLSRCQRFDLRRVGAEELAGHLAEICRREGVDAEPDALALIARAAEGSVRDSLSLLDQAMALSEGPVAAGTVQEMLGLGDRLGVLDLFDALMRGDAAGVLERFGDLYALGADPLALVQDLLDICHSLSRLKVRPEGPAVLGLGGGELLARAGEMADGLSVPALARAWQMLLRGIEEVRTAPDGAAAAEMLLLRLACVADLPPPAELARLLQGGGGGATAPSPAPARPPGRERERVAPPPPRPPVPAATAAPAPPIPVPAAPAPAAPAPAPEVTSPDQWQPGTFAELVRRIEREGDRLLAAWLHEETRPIRFEPGRIELRLGPAVPANLPSRLAEEATRLTGRRWIVAVGSAEGEPTLAEQATDRRRRRIAEVGGEPGFRALLDAFPGAEIVDVREPAADAVTSASAAATDPVSATHPNDRKGALEA